MTGRQDVWRESVLVPWLLLLVALTASLRITTGGELRILAPPLSALVLTLFLLGLLVRAGQLVPSRLMHGSRSGAENLTGAMLLVALGWATSSAIALVIPEAGLPKLAGLVLLFALLANTIAAAPGRLAALRAVVVAFMAGFTVKFILLEAIYSPDRGWGGRLLTGLLDGVTLGTINHVQWAPVTGYLGFFSLLAYFGALALLPRPTSGALSTTLLGPIE